MQERYVRKRKHSKRAIYCPMHKCSLESVSQKYPLYADCPEHLQQQGVRRRNAQILIATQGAVQLNGEWLEKFWCPKCQESKWYHVRKSDRTYNLSVAPRELWQRSQGVYNPEGNPSVGEFTRRNARGITSQRCVC